MLYQFAKHLLVRIPVKTPADYRADLQNFLNDPFFQTALYLATPSFLASLERQQYQTANLSVKELITLQKYINRFCFRPTPFGLFSSVTLTSWIDLQNEAPDVPEFSPYISIAMPLVHRLSSHVAAHIPSGEMILQANPSLYRVLNEYRFFRTGLDDSGKQREYQLQSIAFSKVLKDLITLCEQPTVRPLVVDQIVRSAACTATEAEDYANFLSDAQLLVSLYRSNITGEDHLSRLLKVFPTDENKVQFANAFNPQISFSGPISIKSIKQKEDQLVSLIPDVSLPAEKLSVILSRAESTHHLPLNLQETLHDGISALDLLSHGGQIATLGEFINRFQQYFEGQTLPLMRALDPETGVGYQQPENDKNNPLLETLQFPYRNQPKLGENWSAVHSLMMEVWLRDRSNEPVIRLLEPDLAKLGSDDTKQAMLGMSVLFRKAGKKLFIENAGGINAPALMGRFTVADESIADAARSMARLLEHQNPQLIFAELLHLADPHTDNVNRRAHIYHYELPITAVSTLPPARQLQLSDLYLRIINNTVILFSEKHQKIVIPRLTSAYNHSLNKLPLFRFLSDLSYQYGKSNLGLDLKQLFPNLKFYPRVEYKDTILALATWILTEEQLDRLRDQTEELPILFSKLSSEIKLSQHFSLAEGDQELVFDGKDQRDIEFFVGCIRQKKEVVLKEFILQDTVKQYNAFLLPTDPLPMPKLVTQKIIKAKVQRKYIPGSRWLYLKIYAPRLGVNRLLVQLRPLLGKRYSGHQIDQWFFIRYDDHAPHIRLRLQVNPNAISEVLLAFKAKLEDRIHQHVIREFQIDVYSRELERYAAGGIENTEIFFGASSELAICFLKEKKTSPAASTHTFALYSTQIIIGAFITDLNDQIDFTLQSFQQFLPEFISGSIKVDLDKKFRELSPGITAAFRDADPAIYCGSLKAGLRFKKSMLGIRQFMGEFTDKAYLRSIIHMHLNRIFTDEPRKQEMICYYLLHKYLLSVKGRNKKNR